MPQRKESVVEVLARLKEEASVIRYEERKEDAQIQRDIKLKEIDRDITRIRVDGEVRKTKLTYRWTSLSDLLKKIIYLPALLFLLPFICFLLLKNKPLPKWLDKLI